MATTVLERHDGRGGEIVLRRVDGELEIISGGVFCMSTRSYGSERVLVREALRDAVPPAGVLIGGLGVGYSLAEAAGHPGVERITVVEIEPVVARWHRDHLAARSGGALDDPRVELVIADLVEWIGRTTARFDAICLDIDNGPGWTVRPENARTYDAEGVDRFAQRLVPGGALAVWSAATAPSFRRVLEARFGRVSERLVPVERGEPDRIYVARRPR